VKFGARCRWVEPSARPTRPPRGAPMCRSAAALRSGRGALGRPRARQPRCSRARAPTKSPLDTIRCRIGSAYGGSGCQVCLEACDIEAALPTIAASRRPAGRADRTRSHARRHNVAISRRSQRARRSDAVGGIRQVRRAGIETCRSAASSATSILGAERLQQRPQFTSRQRGGRPVRSRPLREGRNIGVIAHLL
jgi:hypothetical protein